MRYFSLISGLALASLAPAWAQSDGIRLGLAPAYGDEAAARIAPGNDFISGNSLSAVPMAEWEVHAQPTNRVPIAQGTGTAKFDVAGPDHQNQPANASRYEAKAYVFPTGTIRVLTFKKGTPVLHRITFETEIFVLKGSVAVGVGGTPTKLSAGDAVYLPSGDLRNDHPNEDTVVVQFFLTSKPSEKSVVVRGKGLPITTIAEWMDSGKAIHAEGEAAKKAPAEAGRLTVERYAFGDNSIRLVNLRKGGKSNPENHTGTDAILYVTKGRMRRSDGDRTFEVMAGDAVRERLGQPGYWEVLDDSTFIVTDAPR